MLKHKIKERDPNERGFTTKDVFFRIYPAGTQIGTHTEACDGRQNIKSRKAVQMKEQVSKDVFFLFLVSTQEAHKADPPLNKRLDVGSTPIRRQSNALHAGCVIRKN